VRAAKAVSNGDEKVAMAGCLSPGFFYRQSGFSSDLSTVERRKGREGFRPIGGLTLTDGGLNCSARQKMANLLFDK
jgi:hypothetical protein